MGIWLGRIWSARGAAIPRREGWARLVVSLTGYLMCACVLATAVAKGDQVYELGLAWPTAVLAWSLLSDLVVFLGLAGLFALAEARWPKAVWATGPVAFVVAVYVSLNTAYLIIAGEQGSWQALRTLEKQFDDVQMVLEEAMSPAVLLAILGTVVALSAVPVGLRRLARARMAAKEPREASHLRAQAALPVACVAALGVLALPGPHSVAARSLGDNCVAKFVRTASRVLDSGDFEGYAVPNLVDDAEVARFAGLPADRRPNVLMVVLESTRFDHTTLSGPDSLASTPNLLALAQRGTSALQARAFLPHTTKSLFGMLCGRYPTMQRGTIEVADNNPIECVPGVLRDAGYRTGFFQSAFGTFESRPRLVDRLGFRHFRAWETIRGRKLGYLASDDRSLLEPVRRFVDEEGRGPFFVTVLTSAPHHPYRIPGSVRKQARMAQKPTLTDQERYARLVETEDALLGNLLDMLEERDLLENTIVVVMGDHGEGFGAHGVRQHDNNFYEEGLHVPLVIAGPGVPVGVYEENVSLIDLTPTLLGRLGIAVSPETDLPGFDLFSDDHPGDALARPFACYSSWKCRGFVLGARKVVYVPEDDSAWSFDLEVDPFERDPLVLDRELERTLDDVHELVNDHRSRTWRSEYGEMRHLGRWWCLEDDSVCLHPRAFKTKYRYAASRERPDTRGGDSTGED